MEFIPAGGVKRRLEFNPSDFPPATKTRVRVGNTVTELLSKIPPGSAVNATLKLPQAGDHESLKLLLAGARLPTTHEWHRRPNGHQWFRVSKSGFMPCPRSNDVRIVPLVIWKYGPADDFPVAEFFCVERNKSVTTLTPYEHRLENLNGPCEILAGPWIYDAAEHKGSKVGKLIEDYSKFISTHTDT